MACNAYADSARTGSMIGAPKGYLALAPLKKLTLLGSAAPVADMTATAIVGSIVGYLGKNKDLVTETLAKEVFNRKSTPQSNLAPQINLNNLVPEIAPTTVDPDKIAQLKRCLADDSPILGYKFRPLTEHLGDCAISAQWFGSNAL